MNFYKKTCIISFMFILTSCGQDEPATTPPPVTTPPFAGTIFLDPDIITDSDKTTFVSLSYAGQATRTMFDRRVNDWINETPFLFNSTYDDGLSIEIQVNPEFQDSDAAEIEA